MSDSFLTFVQLNPLSPSQRVSLADRLIGDLRRDGIVVPNSRKDRARFAGTSEWLPGPNWSSVTEDDGPGWLGLVNNGVDVITDWQAHDPGSNYEGPVCARCGTLLDLSGETIQGWYEGTEPVVQCLECDWSARIGDWPGDWIIAVGAPALRFNNWGELRPEFVSALRQLMGERTALVRGHR